MSAASAVELRRPDLVGNSEIVMLGEVPLLAYPRGRHAVLQARPPRVTVCVPALQASATLDRALASLQVQTYKDVSVVVLDDASRDDGFTIACRFADDHESFVAYQNPRNVGRVPSYNRCLALAGGEYVKLLSAHDFLLPDCLRTLVAALDADPDVALARCTTAHLVDGELTERPYFPESRALTGASALYHALTGRDLTGDPGAQLVRRSWLASHHLRFREDLSHGAALELSLRLLSSGDFTHRREPLHVRDESALRPAPPAPAEVVFHDECEARLSVLRDLAHDPDARTLARTMERLMALYEELRPAVVVEDADDEDVLERQLASAMLDLGTRLARVTTRARQGEARRVPLDVASLLAEADAEARAQRYQAAEEPIRRILAERPWNVEALNDLGVLRYHQADLDGARKYLTSVLELDPANALARENLAMLGCG